MGGLSSRSNWAKKVNETLSQKTKLGVVTHISFFSYLGDRGGRIVV
jgi:hypothetical protein